MQLPPSLLQGALVFPTREAVRRQNHTEAVKLMSPSIPQPDQSYWQGGVHLAEGGTSWRLYPHPPCFFPGHVLRFIFFLQVYWPTGSVPFLRCTCTWPRCRILMWFPCKQVLGGTSWASEQGWWGKANPGGPLSPWMEALSSWVVVFPLSFTRHGRCHPVLCCTCFRQPLLSSANAERLRGFLGFFQVNLENFPDYTSASIIYTSEDWVD